MARAIGIDITTTHVRAVTVASSYRRNVVERVAEVRLDDHADLAQALIAGVKPLMSHGESIALTIPGAGCYLVRIELPGTALRQIEQIVPFELEARVPVAIEELVHDFVLNREKGESEVIHVVVAAAPLTAVRQFTEQCRSSLGKEAERVGCGSLPLSNLIPYLPKEITASPAVAIVDLAERTTDVLIVQQGRPSFARSIELGVEGLPESAAALTVGIRQTLFAWLAQSNQALSAVYITGVGASVAGAESELSQALELPVLPLPRPQLTFEGAMTWEQLMPFSKAIAVALGLGARPYDPDLRSGPLAYQRGYAFLKEKAPLLAGLTTAMVISMLFASWAGLRTLTREQASLTKQLEAVSEQVLGKSTSDPSAAHEELLRLKSLEESDPMPHMDAFDVMVAISTAIPDTIIHDVEEFDMQREHVKMTGIVSTAEDAQKVANNLKEQRCFQDVKLSKVVQVVNSDRQKYGLEWDVRCPEDDQSKSKKKKADKPEKADDTVGGAR